MHRWIMAIALALLCTAAAAKHVYPKSLTPVVDGVTFVLAESYVVSEKAATFTLAAGATFFFIRRTPDEPHSGNGVLIDSIIRAGYGSFDFPMSNKNDLRLRGQLVEHAPPDSKQ